MLTDAKIDSALYAQCPDFDEWHEGPSIDDVRSVARAIESAATAPLLARIAELTRELEEAKMGAERYQAIRSGLDMDVIVRATKDPGMWETPYPVLLREEELDAAIDAAIKEGGNGNAS